MPPGDTGRLGHGDLARYFRPKVVEALQGRTVVKVAAGNQCSLALTSQSAQVRVTEGRRVIWPGGGGVITVGGVWRGRAAEMPGLKASFGRVPISTVPSELVSIFVVPT